VKRQLALKYFKRDWKQRRHHKFRERIAKGVFGLKVSSPNLKFIGRKKRRAEKRQPANMIEVGMGQVEARLDTLLGHQLVAEVAQTRARVEHQKVVATPNL
jgi:hypothetical protein